MKRKGLLVLMSAVLVLLLLTSGCVGKPAPAPAAPPPTAAEELPTWRLKFQGVGTAADMGFHAGQWIKDIETMTGGRITIDMYSSCEIIPDDQILPAVKAGTLDCSMYMSGCNPSLTPCGFVEMSIPYCIDSPLEWEVLWNYRGLKELIEKDYEEYGVKYVGVWHYDPCSTLQTTRPIEKLEDFKGLKISSFPCFGDPWFKAGATLVNIPPEEFYLAGTTGVCDGIGWGGCDQAYWLGLWEPYPYYLANSCCGSLVGNMIFNQELWDEFGPEIQRMISVATYKSSIRDAVHKWNGESAFRNYWTVTRLSDEDEYELMKYAWQFWDECAAMNPRAAEVVEIFKAYNCECEAARWHRLGRELPFDCSQYEYGKYSLPPIE